MRVFIERLVEEIVAIIVVTTASVVSAYLAINGMSNELREFFTSYVAPLVVPVIAYYFGKKTGSAK